MNKMKKLIAMLLVIALLSSISTDVTVTAKGKNVTCKSLCGVVLKATGGSDKLKYSSSLAIDFGEISASARNKVQSISYVWYIAMSSQKSRNTNGQKVLKKRI